MNRFAGFDEDGVVKMLVDRLTAGGVFVVVVVTMLGEEAYCRGVVLLPMVEVLVLVYFKFFS